AERVVTCEFETNVVPAGCGAEVQRRVADERAVHVDVGAARVRLECQRAPARLGRRATDVVEGGVGYPAILGDGVDDDREALGEAFFTDVADREQVGLVAEAGQLPGVQLGAACYGDHLRQATGRSDVEDVAGPGRRQRDRLTGRDSVLRVEPVGEDLRHLTARLDIEHVDVACFRRSYR